LSNAANCGTVKTCLTKLQLVGEWGMATSLRELVQKDLTHDPSRRLTGSHPTPEAWGHCLKEYLDDLQIEYSRIPGVDSAQRQLAVKCLNLAALCAQTRAGFEQQQQAPLHNRPTWQLSSEDQRHVLFAAGLLIALLIVNIAFSNLVGSLSVLLLLILLVAFRFRNKVMLDRVPIQFLVKANRHVRYLPSQAYLRRLPVAQMISL
jgi:hypothetical protein